jgi:hypothetical protein
VIAPAVRACLYSWSGRTTSEGERLPVSAQPLRISKLDPLMLLPITIEHVIDETSPLFGHTHDSLNACGAEIVVAFEGCVDATGLSFSARQSYLPSEILWGHTFRRIIRRAPSGSTRHEVALARFHELEPQEMLESPTVLKRRGVSFQLGGRALLTAQQMCEATIEAARGGGDNIVPFPAIGANTLALSDSIVIDDSMTTATFRVGDTRSPWGCQFADVVARRRGGGLRLRHVRCRRDAADAPPVLPRGRYPASAQVCRDHIAAVAARAVDGAPRRLRRVPQHRRRREGALRLIFFVLR